MTLLKKCLLLLVSVIICCGGVYAQQTPVAKANYELAERFSAKKMGAMVFSTAVRPNWFKIRINSGMNTRLHAEQNITLQTL